MRKATLFVVILLAANLMAQTTNTATTVATYAEVTFTAPDGTLGTFFVSHVSSPPFFCDLSCTELGYSFCVIPCLAAVKVSVTLPMEHSPAVSLATI